VKFALFHSNVAVPFSETRSIFKHRTNWLPTEELFATN